jgi:hypothetical protein
VRIIAWTPQKLSSEEKELHERLREISSQTPPPPGRGTVG